MKISFIPFFLPLACQGSLRAIKSLLMSKWWQSFLSTRGKVPILPRGCATRSPMPSSFARTLARCSCNITRVNGILSHTISTEQTCHFFHLTTSAISPSALIISPTPYFLDYEPLMFQKTSAFLPFWKDTIAAALHRQNQNWVHRRNEKIMISFLSKFKKKKGVFERAGSIHFPVCILEILYIHIRLCDCLVT